MTDNDKKDDQPGAGEEENLLHENQNDEQNTSDNNGILDNSNRPNLITLKPFGILQIADPRSSGSSPLAASVFTATWRQNVLSTNPVGQNHAKSEVPGAVSTKRDNYGNNGNNNRNFPGPPPPNSPKSDLTFKDCGGLEKQVNFLKTAVLDLIRSQNLPESENKFQRFGLDPPKGILFYGPPGTGKTRLAQALGNELTKILGQNVHFIYRKGMDIANKYFGQSSANLRAVFDEAKGMQPSVLFFDELDGLCPTRDKPFMNQANVTIVTTMLGLMDELPKGKVFVIAATNRLDAVDQALRRPGRFDKYLEFLPPPVKGRFDILSIHTRKWKVQPEKGLLDRLSQKTVGFSGADLSKLCLDAFDHALRRCLSQNNDRGINLSDVNLNTLEVTEKDWTTALGNMKPSNSAVFGSTLYTPPQSLDCNMQPLIQVHVEKIKEMLLKLFPNNMAPISGNDQNIHSVYVWSHKESSTASIDDFIISQVLRSNQVGQYPVYCISSEILSSTTTRNWPSKVNDAFNQAVGAGTAILYIQNISELWDLVYNSGLGVAIDLKHQLERLRGTSVVLLATCSTKLPKLSPDNPFLGAFSSSADRSYEVRNPSDNERSEFFQLLFTSILMEGDGNWSEDDVIALSEVHDEAVKCTLGKNIGSIVLLYELLVVNHTNIADKNDKNAIVRELLQLVGNYKMSLI